MFLDGLPWLLQLSDSQFPGGGYAHSSGLEEIVRLGIVKNPDDLANFLETQVVPALLHFDLPWLARSHTASAACDALTLADLDRELFSRKLPAELRQAAQRIGSRRFALLRQLDADAFLDDFASQKSPCLHLTVCALECRCLPLAAACAAWSYQTISGQLSASLKLIRIGQESCQRILHRTLALLSTTPTAAPDDEPGWFNPLLEIASMRHAISPERLFLS